MTIAMAKRISTVRQSPTLAVAAKAMQLQSQGLDVINLGVGEPDFDTPQHIENGDEVLILASYWVSYPDIVLLSNGIPVIIHTNSANQYKVLPEQLEQMITAKTKLIFINSPSNPSGIAYTLEELQALGAVLRRYPQVLIATDDIYEHIVWSRPFCNILNACPDLYSRTVVFNGVSKAYAMTGWRIGYAGGSLELIAAIKN